MISLQPDEVHIWTETSQPEDLIRQYLQILSTDEKTRAARYYFEEDRHRFIISRGTLRTILGNYLSLPESQIIFSYTAYGKPFLAESQLNFNLSDTKGLVVFAFTLNREIGIDTEHLHHIDDLEDVAQRFFSAEEVRELEKVTEEKKDWAFLSCWTLKESYIKAIGEGLSCPLDQYGTDFMNIADPSLLFAKWDKNEKERWRMYRIQVPDGYIAALTVEGKEHNIVYKDEEILRLTTHD